MRDAVHDDFQWNRHLLFDLFSRNPWPLRNDFNIVVGDVGIGLNGKVAERDDARSEKYQRESQHQQAIVESKIDDSTNHLLLHRVLQYQSIRNHLIPGLDTE